MTESFILSLFVYPNFLCTTCVASWLFVPWKRFGPWVMSQSYFISCPSENTFFGKTTTRKKRTQKSRKHLLRRDSDSEKKIAGWQIPLAVTSSTWYLLLFLVWDFLLCLVLFFLPTLGAALSPELFESFWEVKFLYASNLHWHSGQGHLFPLLVAVI